MESNSTKGAEMMKKFIAGLIIGIGVSFALAAHAEVKNFVGEVIQGQFPVKVDGQTIENPGIVIDGTSYLPTRTIAELAGFDVKFDADLGIELTKKVELQPVQQPVSEAVDVDYIKSEIEKINNQIRGLKLTISIETSNVNSPLVTNEEGKEQSRNNIKELEARVAELEAQKAALEAQLTQAP
jgi:hypothetical protein